MLACCLLRLRAHPAYGRSPCFLPRAMPTQSPQHFSTKRQNFRTLLVNSAGCHTSVLPSCCHTATQLSCDVRRRTAARTGGLSLVPGFGCAVPCTPFLGTPRVQRLPTARPGGHLSPSSSSYLLVHGRRCLHSIAANLQRRGAGSAGDSEPTLSVASSTLFEPEPEAIPHESSATSPSSDALYTAEPSEGSYAQELLQHIHDVTHLAASAKDATGSLSSPGWFVDWLLALKLGLGVPWYVVLPTAGCLLRLLTLPIAIDSERDRRQRQLVDPQFSRMKDKMKLAYETGNTQEYQRLRAETKTFLKKHGIGVLPTSFFQMLLLGLAISLSTPAIREMAGAPYNWKGFAVEQPGWLESLALPDSSGLAAVLCWLVLLSTMAAGWMISSKIRKRSPSTSAPTGLTSPTVMRGVSVGAATLFAFYSGTQLPAAALLFLVPAFGLQSIFIRIFRLRSIERGLHFVPEELRPLQQTYVALLERREPALVAAWKQRVADAQSSDAIAEAAAGSAAATSRAIVQLWREISQKRGAAAPQQLKTWAEHVARKQRESLSQAA